MATIVAQANGNFSDTATWTGGVVPGAGDTAQTGNYIVTIDASITCTLNPTGSGYFLVTSGGITITGDLVMQSSYTGGGLRATHGSGTVALTGTATAGAGVNAYGAFNAAAGTLTIGTATGGAGNSSYGAVNAGAGTMTVGTATGGAGNGASGALNNSAGTLTVGTATGGAGNGASGALNNSAGTLTVGTATGGAGSSAHGALNNSAGTLTVGTATGGAGNGAHGAYNAAAGTLTVDLAVGNGWGVGGSGGYAYGVYGSGATGQTTRVKRTQSGPYGAPAIGGAVLMLADASNSAQFRTAYGGGTLTLTDPSASADWPAESDVRAGVKYDNGDQTGTAHIPAAGSVALGIPVDATVGTAVLTAAAVTAGVWDAARSGHAGAGTFGATDEWAGSVDEAAIATAAAAAILVTPANKLATDANNAASANVTYSAGVALSGRLAEVTDLPSEPLDATATQAAAAAALAAYDPPTLAELTSAVAPLALEATVGALPTAAENADAVLDELLSGHTIPGSAGAGIAAAGTADDPWSTALPGSYNSGTAGAIIGALAAIDTTAVTITPANNAGHLTITAARTFEATISGLTIPADWVTALWTLKTDDSRPDTAALVQLRETNPAALSDGLQRLNGAALPSGVTAAAGSLTVNQAGGSVVVWLSDEVTARLGKATGIGWDVKFIDAAGDSDGADGTADVALTETKATA